MFHGSYLLLAGVPALLIYAAHRRRSGTTTGRLALETAFLAYVLLVVAVVFFPLRVSPALRADDAVWDYATFVRPLGAFAPALVPRFRHASSILVLAFASGIGIEALQYLARVARFSLRSVDIDDAILNVAGALIGYSLWRVWAHTRRRLLGRKQVAA